MKDTSRITLRNKRLKVDIQKPGTAYRGSRFDWCGMIEQVELDGSIYFGAKESLDPNRGTGGFGFCNEFGIEHPIGYDETALGDYFPKIGIGMIERESIEEYDFFKPHRIKENEISYEVSTLTEPTAVTFSTKQKQINGYAFIYEKTIKLEDNKIQVSYFLLNTGVKKITTTEYCHNFVALNQTPIDENYELKLNSHMEFTKEAGSNPLHEVLSVEGDKITWMHPVKEVFYLATNGINQLTSWRLKHKKTGVTLKETVDDKVIRFALWGEPHVVSPEMFVSIAIKPGESKRWTRLYEFAVDRIIKEKTWKTKTNWN